MNDKLIAELRRSASLPLSNRAADYIEELELRCDESRTQWFSPTLPCDLHFHGDDVSIRMTAFTGTIRIKPARFCTKHDWKGTIKCPYCAVAELNIGGQHEYTGGEI